MSKFNKKKVNLSEDNSTEAKKISENYSDSSENKTKTKIQKPRSSNNKTTQNKSTKYNDSDSNDNELNSKSKAKSSKSKPKSSKCKSDNDESNESDDGSDFHNKKIKAKNKTTKIASNKDETESDSNEENVKSKAKQKHNKNRSNDDDDTSDVSDSNPKTKKKTQKKVSKKDETESDSNDTNTKSKVKKTHNKEKQRHNKNRSNDDDDTSDISDSNHKTKNKSHKKVSKKDETESDSSDTNTKSKVKKTHNKEKQRHNKNRSNDDDSSDVSDSNHKTKNKSHKKDETESDSSDTNTKSKAKNAHNKEKHKKRKSSDNSDSEKIKKKHKPHKKVSTDSESDSYSRESNAKHKSKNTHKRGMSYLPNSKQQFDDDDYGHFEKAKKDIKCDSEFYYNVRTSQGRQKIAQQTQNIISYGKSMGKYTIRHKDDSIEHVDISKLISNSYKFSFTKTDQKIDQHTQINDSSDSMNDYDLSDDDYNQYSLISKTKPMMIQRNVNQAKFMCKFFVVKNSSLGAARSLVKKDHLKTCIFNFTSPTKPYGSFLSGSESQEESLMRQTALYSTVKNSSMYKQNANLNDGVYSNTMIYSSKVPVFRSSFKERLLSSNEVFLVSIITTAAPNMKQSQSNYITRNPISVLKKRIKLMINLAHENHDNALVIGVYGNDLFDDKNGQLAQMFNNLFVEQNLGKFFVKVVFAIIGERTDNFTHFSQVFNQ